MDLSFLERDYTVPSTFLYLFTIFSVIIFLRYIFLSSLYQKMVYDKIAVFIPSRIISSKYPKDQQVREIIWSGISSILFAIIGVLMIMAWQSGITRIYTDWATYPLWYIPISGLLALLMHETYYYWLHRWFHHPSVYRYLHKVHHDSINTSVWTSFSFHPIESILQAIIIPLITFVIPMHLSVLLFLLIFMTISAIINHAGVEIFPASWFNHPLCKYFIGSTHHDLHHRRFTKNYGLYFTFWDRWMGTESYEYEERYKHATDPKRV
ncbi:MAG: lathosterol oxidase [Saprospiraceae bacterium]|jgi:lathosterol oxidase